MANNARADNLAKLIREVVAEKLQRGIKDPRIQNNQVTVTDTRVTGDLREGTVFYTVYGGEEERAAVAAGLESAKGMLRSEVGKAAGIKHTPSLTFIPDALPENARAMEELFSAARERDARLRREAEGAGYAGDPDPYRRPAAEDEEAGEGDGGGSRA
ncbi:30S ribosome-binding factor RbfA [Streptomyces calidiresistens]|uniref:Ribosome-binding factor A n=1 Tax=Streptomyces calidiresistens TaxID=1485586 RepID=A0A7W3T319_9ACTN|nr:30S ribosome-binding factor RbfA [Streptomyces calidiresistens]MBB0229983.1 30S ribosome-binding factor RbfA [Streptomyces calidiresistens]